MQDFLKPKIIKFGYSFRSFFGVHVWIFYSFRSVVISEKIIFFCHKPT